MEFKGTKGKWKRWYNDYGYIASIRNDEGKKVFTSRVNNMDESNANMALAESAPEMFEMLKVILQTNEVDLDEIEQLLTKITE